MRKKISFFVVNTSGSPIRQFAASVWFLRLAALSVFACLVLFGYIVYDYYNLKSAFFHSHKLENQIAAQLNEITNQRNQIQNFANEINSLKGKLISLNGFEKKIRTIANIEQSENESNLFGIGGSIPEDLDANIELVKKHNSLIREMHEQVGQLEFAASTQKKGFESLLKYLQDQRNLLAATPAVRPTRGWVTSRFGYRISPFTGRREFHKGLDIATRKGTPIIATADGVVTYAGNKGLLGKTLVIDHGHGMVTRYGHCDKLLKKAGTRVKRGDSIATIGNTGRSTGSHVHYEVRLNGVPVNPEKYILN
ncbi:MAG: peptidoglycan DD-metalloendopeptidase family protein [Desulfobacterales bacterium]|nr:peptidoglycan DD-metalloendopeptidase family protein [Desulfobacterales bacterium]